MFKEIINLRDELGSITETNNNILVGLMNNSAEYTGSTQIDNILMTVDSTNATFRDQVSGLVKAIPISEFSDHLDDDISGTSLKVSDYLSTLANSSDLYGALGSITSKFSYSSRMSLTDVNALIDGATNGVASLNYDITDLKQQLVSCSNNDGYITSKSWLVTLKGWFDNAHASAEDEVPELDTTAPNSLSGVYNVVIQSITAVISAVFTALSIVFGRIIALVGSLISNIFGAVSSYYQSGGTLDLDCPNTFVKGPIAYWQINPAWYNGFPSIQALGNDRSIHYLESMGIAHFYWLNQDKNLVLNNSYLYPCFSYKDVNEWISEMKDYGLIDWMQPDTDGNPDLYRNGVVLVSAPPTIPSMDHHNEVALSFAEVTKALCVDMFVRYLVSLPDDGGFSVEWGRTNNGSGQTWYYTKSHMISVGAKIVAGYRYFNDVYKFTNQTEINDVCTHMMNVMYPIGPSPTLEEVYAGPGTDINGGTFLLAKSSLHSINYTMTDRPINPGGFYLMWSYSNSTWTVSHRFWSRGMMITNCLPTSFAVELNGATLDDTVSVLALSALVAIASAVVLTKTAKAIRIRKSLKATLRADNLSKLRDAYLADPTNKEKAMKYGKAVDKYNRMGKILGWGSYDGVNNWVDKASNGNSAAGLITTTTSIPEKINSYVKQSLFGNAEEPSDILTTLSQLTNTVNSISDTVTRIKNLIKTE